MYAMHVVYVTGQARRWAFILEDQNIVIHFLYTGSLIQHIHISVEKSWRPVYVYVCRTDLCAPGVASFVDYSGREVL